MSTYWSLIHMSAPQSVRRPRRPAAIRTSFRIFAWASSETRASPRPPRHLYWSGEWPGINENPSGRSVLHGNLRLSSSPIGRLVVWCGRRGRRGTPNEPNRGRPARRRPARRGEASNEPNLSKAVWPDGRGRRGVRGRPGAGRPRMVGAACRGAPASNSLNEAVAAASSDFLLSLTFSLWISSPLA